jgi:ABC-type lipoprotein release transport system permease subunit
MEQAWIAWPWLIAALVGAGLVALGLVALVLTTSVYKHVICMKYLFSGWKAVVPLVSAMPAALGVFLLILVFAIMDGFAQDTREVTRGTLADIIVDAHFEGLPYYDDFAARIEKIDGVEVATPVIQTFAMVRVKPAFPAVRATVQPCMLIGIRPGEKVLVGRFHQYLQRQLSPSYPADELLTVPPSVVEARRKAGLPDRPGAVAGIGLVSYPVKEIKAQTVDVSAVVILAWSLVGVLALGAAAVGYRAMRRYGHTTPAAWLAALYLLVAPAIGAVLLAAHGVGLLLPADQPFPAPKLTTAVSSGEIWLTWGGVAALAVVWIVAAILVFLSRERRFFWLRPVGLMHFLGGAAALLAFWSSGLQYGPHPVAQEQVVDELAVPYGGEIVVSTIPISARGAFGIEAGGVPKVNTRALTLVDTFKSGFWESDASHIYVDFSVAQALAGMDGRPAAGPDEPAAPARASQVQVKVRDPARSAAIVERIRDAWRQFVVERPDAAAMVSVNTWEAQQKTILGVVEMEKNITALMLGTMFLGFGVLIALISYVMAYIKSRDVGILKALGARDVGVGSLFLGYGFIVGLLGTAAGLVGALLMIHYLDPIEVWVNQTLHTDVFPRTTYYFEHIPRHLSVAWCVGVSLAVLVLSTLASLAGGLLAAIKQPVETLRDE